MLRALRIRSFQLLPLTLMFLSACKGGGAECDNSEDAGYRTIVRDDVTREVILHVPASYDDDTPAPLLINFHGFGGCASQFVAETGEGESSLSSVADDGSFLVAYPQGVERTKGAAEWDPGDNGSPDIGDNDVAFTEQLVAEIGSDFNVDPARVFAAGYSNGGMMAYGPACAGDLIAGAGIMSGIMLPQDCADDARTSIIHFHGLADDVLPYDGNQDFQAVAEVVEFWLEQNSIPPSNLVATELNGGDVLRDEYSGGEGETSVVLYTVRREFGKDGGHVWFTDAIDGRTPNQILWDFLAD